ncbi:EAL domain-containing protein [Massilia horti]|uniref:EAL domain-containing protein n=1 Tax=Massilia horti TaxID=2562153 RepID=A0A4Y9T9C6_9BURK|nr:EAL domain-containing protein [Massilia horti]TFW35695.1 EAL domain-containing protein [Massilia horti]
MPRFAFHGLSFTLNRLYGGSIYAALLLVVCGGLVVPAVVGCYVIVGVQARQAAERALDESLRRNADILAHGVQAALRSRDREAARSLVDSVMGNPAVVHVAVRAPDDPGFIDVRAAAPAEGRLYRAEREIVAQGQPIGRIEVEMDDRRNQQQLHERQSAYAMVLGCQLGVSLLLIVLFLRRRLLWPLRALTQFSDRLAKGDFDTPLELHGRDELGRLGGQMDRMRGAIRQLFADVARREERFRTMMTQVPGAVFRASPGGQIDFVSDAILEITGYPAAWFMRCTTDAWSDIISPEDRRMQLRLAKEAIQSGRPYAIEYRIIDAAGVERWVLESGQPVGEPGTDDLRVDGIISDISMRKHDEMRIEALLAEQGAIVDNVMFGVVFVRGRRVVSANHRAEELFGYADGELLGASALLLLPDQEQSESAWEEYAMCLARGDDAREERQFRRADGTLIWCMVSGRALDRQYPDDGSIWVYADVTERRLAEQKLRLAGTVLEHMADGVAVIGVNGKLMAINPGFTQITGYTEFEMLGQQVALTRSHRHDEAFYASLWRELSETGFWRGEIWNKRKNGDDYLEWLTISAVRDEAGEVTHYVGVFSDITQLKESQEKLDHLAHHDPLTALPNRLLFHDRLQHALARAARDQQQLAVMFIDLDRFKNVNDTLGHDVGDELLKQVARALACRLRAGDTLARLGGDEFIVLLENVDGESGAGQVADKLMTMFEQPFTVSGHELFITGSVGISLFPRDGADLSMLVRNADVAMYQAKARGRNGYRFYAPSMSGDGALRLRLESLLRRSIEKNEIRLAFQPQVEIDSKRLIGVEALVRWHNAELGEVPPARLIPVAEDTGFINQLGNWVLVEACRQMVRWEQEGLYVPKIAVNLSVRQFERGCIAALVADVLRETGLEPRRLQLEVTESVIMHTSDALALVNDLHAIGVGLAIDDFGTGYSSLAYLKQLPVETLKIDRSFIKDIAADADDEAIVVAITQLGKSMNLSVIAEGVENEEQAAFLLRHGCNRAQGYLYGRPVPAAELLKQWRQMADEVERSAQAEPAGA